jgi:DNA-binding MarR family transcriptional regulator
MRRSPSGISAIFATNTSAMGADLLLVCGQLGRHKIVWYLTIYPHFEQEPSRIMARANQTPATLPTGEGGPAPAAADPSLGYLIRYAHRAFVKALAQELEPHGISTGEWSALRVLWMREGSSQVELAERMRVEKASLTGVLNSLEAKGLIVRARNRDDRRKINLRLTPAGRRLEARLLACAHAINEKATQGLPPAQVGEVRSLLTAFIANLEQPAAP